MSIVTPEDVNALTKPTEGFLCPLSSNNFGIEFLQFTISDYQSKNTIFAVGKDNPTPQDIAVDFSCLGEDMYRKIKYTFSEDVLRLPLIQTSLVFSVGSTPLNGFRMIERHYFRDQLVKSFDFAFGFCIPGSTNTWDSVYSLPPLSEELIKDMIDHPFETKSDSFYFVNGKLIMHNKASYKYIREDSTAGVKKSYEDKFSAKLGAKGAKGAKDLLDDEADSLNLDRADLADAKPVAPRGGGAKGSKDIAWSKESDYY
uniref:GMP phosphodiesterase delta subunit domain-containing protein n=1 Tax=Spumella elongata TaxID=89044 RepID=A0A7S3MAT2_9STRA|mmetsp:Transcript_46584/g.81422  ORF Transcript_46584/g.81422 Transcript_46584/m.81422 type:complete len:257 (+) Transcript_46584:116-886(+)|eukprot:CAMPEP_0184990840 /NCGR_PEP_ID=MMETSP1098-20130426/34128_1 /TAXON_ID=89044 /ORGANISM="Spumella elongata, Strain CCAP 955/1" /LENGTH=256 /DNA_ID=CAMNT_0027516121 /DNA_START=118 /DNA_END=888 /DNA_ORIENTATION=+